MVDMEQNFLEDKNYVYLKELINKLLQLESDINIMIHDTNDNNDLFERLNKVKIAIQKAKYMIEKIENLGISSA